VRDKLQRGDLPREKCLITWFGPGSGQRCVVCDRAIGVLGNRVRVRPSARRRAAVSPDVLRRVGRDAAGRRSL